MEGVPQGSEQGRPGSLRPPLRPGQIPHPAAVYMAHPHPMETILLSIILEHEKMLGEILGKVKEKEGKND